MTAKSSDGRGLRLRSKGRKASSTRWLERQLNDPYVAAAKSKGYRSRAAFKLIELDDKFHLFKEGATVIDLGAAPGGWTQIARSRVGARGHVVAADILDIEPITGVEILKMDISAYDALEQLRAVSMKDADVVLSDMAAPTTGHRATDHLRTVALFEAALEVAEAMLKPGGAFVGKLFQGGAAPELLGRLKKTFREVKHVKPPASRAQSVELYLVALGFRGKSQDRSATTSA